MKTYSKLLEEYHFKIKHSSLAEKEPIDWKSFSSDRTAAVMAIAKKTSFVPELLEYFKENYGIELEFGEIDTRNSIIDCKAFNNSEIDGIAKYMFKSMTIYFRCYIQDADTKYWGGECEGDYITIDPRVSYDHLSGGSNGSDIFGKFVFDLKTHKIEKVSRW